MINILEIFPICLQAETELRLSQSEFDRQAEITKLLMEGLSQSQTNHVRHLKAFVAAQVITTKDFNKKNAEKFKENLTLFAARLNTTPRLTW